MKQLLLLTILSLFFSSAYCQLNKKQFIVGGSISFSSSTNKGDDLYQNKSTTLQLSPNLGYFVFDNLVLGGKTGVTFFKSKVYYENVSKYNSSTISLSPFIRYYILPKNNKLNVFAETDFSYLRTTETDLNGENTRKKTGGAYTILAGPVYFVNPYIALELTLSYNSSKYREDTYSTNIFMTGLGFQIHLGNKKNKS